MKNINFTLLGQYKIIQTNKFYLILTFFLTSINSIFCQINSGSNLLQLNSAIDISYNLNTGLFKKLHVKADTSKINIVESNSLRRSFDNGQYLKRINSSGNSEILWVVNSNSSITPSKVKYQVLRDGSAYYYDSGLNYLEEIILSTTPDDPIDVQDMINEIIKSESQRRSEFSNTISCLRNKGALINIFPTYVNIEMSENGKRNVCKFSLEGRLLERFNYEIETNRLLNSDKIIYQTNSQNLVVPKTKIKMTMDILGERNIPIEVYEIDDYSNYRIDININGIAFGRNNEDEDNFSVENIKLVPNPTVDHLIVNLPIDIEVGSIYKITDLNGNKIIQNKIEDRNFTISLPDLSNGLYFFQIDSNAKKYVKKFSVNK